MKILLIAIFLFTVTASAQTPAPSPCLTADDLKTLRQALADRDFYKQRAENAEAMVVSLTASRDAWKALSEAEKQRADVIQGGRIGQLQAALDIAKVQMDADRQKIGEQNAEIIRLKSGRKFWFAAGAAVGGIGGFFVGRNVNTIQTFIPGQSARPSGIVLRF